MILHLKTLQCSFVIFLINIPSTLWLPKAIHSFDSWAQEPHSIWPFWQQIKQTSYLSFSSTGKPRCKKHFKPKTQIFHIKASDYLTKYLPKIPKYFIWPGWEECGLNILSPAPNIHPFRLLILLLTKAVAVRDGQSQLHWVWDTYTHV